jgi:hypothetical protein
LGSFTSGITEGAFGLARRTNVLLFDLRAIEQWVGQAEQQSASPPQVTSTLPYQALSPAEQAVRAKAMVWGLQILIGGIVLVLILALTIETPEQRADREAQAEEEKKAKQMAKC